MVLQVLVLCFDINPCPMFRYEMLDKAEICDIQTSVDSSWQLRPSGFLQQLHVILESRRENGGRLGSGKGRRTQTARYGF